MRNSFILILALVSKLLLAAVQACVGQMVGSITLGSGRAATNAYQAQLQCMFGDGWQVRNFGFNRSTLLNHGNRA